MENNIKYQIDEQLRCRISEAANVLGSMMLAEKYGLLIDNMCDEYGEFTDDYQCEFESLYAEIETILTEILGNLDNGTGEG